MWTKKLLLTENWQDIEKAKELGMKIPDAKQNLTEFVFRLDDIKNAVVDGDRILMEFYGEETFAFRYDKELWEEIREYFKQQDI